MQFNAVISLIKSNNFPEAKALLDELLKNSEFKNPRDQGLLASVQAYLFIKDKKYQEALDCLKLDDDMQDVRNVLLQSHLLLALKKQKESIINLV